MRQRVFTASRAARQGLSRITSLRRDDPLTVPRTSRSPALKELAAVEGYLRESFRYAHVARVDEPEGAWHGFTVAGDDGRPVRCLAVARAVLALSAAAMVGRLRAWQVAEILATTPPDRVLLVRARGPQWWPRQQPLPAA